MGKKLMFSAGMDSYILKHVYKIPDRDCVFVHMGTKENEIELQKINKYFPRTQIIYMPVLNDFALPNYIIPFRNSFLVLITAQFGNDIYCAFTAGDTTRDKDFVFKAQMEGLLNYFAGIPEKVNISGPYTVTMPFKQLTKTEIVALYLQRKGTVEHLLTHSVSCYEAIDCGKCRSCLRKFIALKMNGYDTKNHFQNNPYLHLLEFLNESRKKGRGKEVQEIEKCLDCRA